MLANLKPQTGALMNQALTLALVLVLAAAFVRTETEPAASVRSSGGDSVQPQEQFAPKRQYFIAPRIGRSFVAGGTAPHFVAGQQVGGRPQAIWSSLEEASLMAPGQIQPNRGFPGPLRSSLLFLINNRRLIGPRSASGLLPQARIGRRAAPSGLLPQPRVGRRSSSLPSGMLFDGELDATPASGTVRIGAGQAEALDGQQEVAVATLSDNAALNDAVESLISG